MSKLSLFRDLLMTFGPLALVRVPGGRKIAPFVPTILDAIDEAQQIPGAKGSEKKTHVENVVRAGAEVAKAAGANVDPDELVAIAGHGIDATIGTINAVKKAHVAPADVEHGDPSPASLNAPEPGPSDLATR